MAGASVSPGDIVGDKYLVEALIGQGGMSAVYAALHLLLGQRVALKVLYPRHLQDERVRARFLREAQASVRLRGEHVARVLDVGTLPGAVPYIVMEYLEGEDLASYLARSGRLPVPVAVDCILQACVGVAEAHAAGVIHRDLKPSNLFLARGPDQRQTLKVLDFGVSKLSPALSTTDLTQGSVLGTPQYMSPEQMRSSKDVDERADVWSLGVILYELLTASSPFERPTFVEVCTAVTQATVPRPRSLRRDVPSGLDAVLRKALQRSPPRRFRNVTAFAEALAPYGSVRAPVYLEAIRGMARSADRRSSFPAAALSLDTQPRAVDLVPTLAVHGEGRRSWLRASTSRARLVGVGLGAALGALLAFVARVAQVGLEPGVLAAPVGLVGEPVVEAEAPPAAKEPPGALAEPASWADGSPSSAPSFEALPPARPSFRAPAPARSTRPPAPPGAWLQAPAPVVSGSPPAFEPATPGPPPGRLVGPLDERF